MPALERAVEQETRGDRRASGLTDLDAMTSGFQQTDLIIIAARPSMGKTALALEAAMHAALREAKANVGIFSLEMSKRQLGLRALMSEAGIDGHRMRTGFLGERDYGRISRGHERAGEREAAHRRHVRGHACTKCVRARAQVESARSGSTCSSSTTSS
jgi:replicative DNA helicase